MKIQNLKLLILVLFCAISVRAEDSNCSRIFSRLKNKVSKIASNFNSVGLQRLNSEFAEQEFLDKNNKKFKVMPLLNSPNEGLLFKFNIFYVDSPSRVIQTSYSPFSFGDSKISAKGNIDFNLATVELEPKLRGVGLIKAPMQWWLNKLPKGSTITINDTSKLAYLKPQSLMRKEEQVRLALDKEGPLDELWEVYLRAYAIQNPGLKDRPSFEGYLHYVYDLFSLWGTMFRQVHYRSDYSQRGIASTNDLVLIKGELNADFLAEENAFISKNTRVIKGTLESIVHNKPKKTEKYSSFLDD